MTETNHNVDRRSFLKAAGGVAAAGTVSPLLNASLFAGTKKASADTAVGEFYASLTAEQKKAICFDWNSNLRTRISANWHVVKQEIGSFYDKKQQGMIDNVIRSITSEDGYKLLQEQMLEDSGGVDFYSVAIFGEPGGKGPSQLELTGRHLTLRADGNHNDKVAFGGPTVYGHSESDPAQNLFHSQTKAVNKVFQALDKKQAAQALQSGRAPRENRVQIQGAKGRFPGIAVGGTTDDQKKLVSSTLEHLLEPFNPTDVKEVMQVLKAGGGLDKLHFAFYQQGDLKNDKVWDIWRVEGPSFVWHFRGAPHVHAYINIAAKNQA